MQIRSLKVKNFRGIRTLEWSGIERLHLLIGPGDSCKTTILEAITYCLSPTWRLGLSDQDFFGCDPTRELHIEVVVTGFPRAICTEEKYGLDLSGWHESSGLVEEPEDGTEAALRVQLRAGESLEPLWTVVSSRNPDGVRIGWRDRELLGVSWLAALDDAHLAWGRASALTRLTESTAGANDAIVGVYRSLRTAMNWDAPGLSPFRAAATKAQAISTALGVERQSDFSPNIDTRQISVTLGAVALHEGTIPVQLRGLGSRRLLAMGLQQESTADGAIVIIDEVETALEPHRLITLLQTLKSRTSDGTHGQAIATTHSTDAIAELGGEHVRVVRRAPDGEVEVLVVPQELWPALRGSPGAFLARRLIVCEGKTELGLARALQGWLVLSGRAPFIAAGTAPVFGGGGSGASAMSIALRGLGFDVAFFGDSDVEPTPSRAEMEAAGVKVLMWAGTRHTEMALALDLPDDGVKALVAAAVRNKGKDSVNARLSNHLGASGGERLSWEDLDFAAERTRTAVGSAAHEGEWFKRIDLAEELGNDVVFPRKAHLERTDIGLKFEALTQWAYGADG